MLRKKITPFLKHFPADIVELILQHISSKDTQNFALASSWCNEIAIPRIWRTFYVGFALFDATAADVREACDALLRIPRRARSIVRLLIYPCTWSWDEHLLSRFRQVWKAVPQLLDLILCEPGSQLDHQPYNDFAPLIRDFNHSQQHLPRLRVFRYRGWLREGTELYHFLESHPTIEELIGVDSFVVHPPLITSGFLPRLTSLTSSYASIVLALLPSRPLRALSIREPLESEIAPLMEACELSNNSFTHISLNYTGEALRGLEHLARILRVFPDVDELDISCLEIDGESMSVLNQFTKLKVLTGWSPDRFHTLYAGSYEHSPESVREWASSLSETVCHVTFIGYHDNMETWIKVGGSERYVLSPRIDAFLSDYPIVVMSGP